MPPESVTVELLRELPLFAGLSDAQLSMLVPLARLEEVAADQRILDEGGPATELRVVVTGKFSLCLSLGGQESCLLTMTRGEILGWSALLDNPSWLASATAVQPASVLVIDGRTLLDLCESHHEIGYYVMRNLFAAVSARLYDTRLQLLDMYGHA